MTVSRYGWLDTRYPVANTVRVIALKTVLDQTLLTIPLLLVFFPYMSWCQGQSDITKELREKFWVTYAASCCWFLPAQAINFKFVPARSVKQEIKRQLILFSVTIFPQTENSL